MPCNGLQGGGELRVLRWRQLISYVHDAATEYVKSMCPPVVKRRRTVAPSGSI